MPEYSINCAGEDNEICEIFVTGAVETDPAIEMLNEIWDNDIYTNARFVIWDMERCESLPDFNQFLRLVNHARANKPAGGPEFIAFYSSVFSNSMLARVLQGFIRALPYQMSLFAKRDSALAWFQSKTSHAA